MCHAGASALAWRRARLTGERAHREAAVAPVTWIVVRALDDGMKNKNGHEHDVRGRLQRVLTAIVSLADSR